MTGIIQERGVGMYPDLSFYSHLFECFGSHEQVKTYFETGINRTPGTPLTLPIA
jgi:hypothetical protein